MNVKEFSTELSKFPEDMEVIISDGMKYNFYHTDEISFDIFEGKVDIGIGGCNENL
jgi:hypothetical protein